MNHTTKNQTSLFSKSRFTRARRAKLSAFVLDGADAEFLLDRVANGKFKIRIGQVWNMPVLRGQSYILLDLDNTTRVSRYGIRRRLAVCGLSIVSLHIRRSPSGTGYHVQIIVRGILSRFQRIAIQAICESDPTREANNFRRAFLARREWQEDWNILYKGRKRRGRKRKNGRGDFGR
jgi:hypothetical protein